MELISWGTGVGPHVQVSFSKGGIAPWMDFRKIKAFRVLRRLISAAFFQTKSKKWGGNSGKGRHKPWRGKALIEKISEGKSAEVLMQPAELEKENLFLKKEIGRAHV